MKMEPMLLNQRNGADCFGIKKLYWSTVFCFRLEQILCFRLEQILTAFGALLLCFEGEYIVLKQ